MPPTARVQAAAIGIDADDRDLVGQGGVGQEHLHPVVVGPDIKRVLVGQRDLHDIARRAALGVGRDPRDAAADRLAHDVAIDRGQHGDRVFLLTGEAHDAALAVADGLMGRHGFDGAGGDLAAHGGAGLGQVRKILPVGLPGEGGS